MSKTIEERLAWLEDRLSPLDQQAEEAQPAKDTEKMELPWQDVGTFNYNTHQGAILLKYNQEARNAGYPNYAYLDNGGTTFSYIQHVTHWFPITPPKAKTVEAPVEPERVSYPDFAFEPVGKWYSYRGKGATEFKEHATHNDQCRAVCGIISSEQSIYATDPTAWLAWKAEQ